MLAALRCSGRVQQIAASIFAILLFGGAILLIVTSPLVPVETMRDVGGTLGHIIGFLLSGLAILIACSFLLPCS